MRDLIVLKNTPVQHMHKYIQMYLYTDPHVCLSTYIHTYLCVNMHAYSHACQATYIPT